MIQKLGFLSGQVRYFGGEDIVLNQLYRKAQAYVHPSLLEGFGLPPLESMAHSCPVISSNSSVMPEILGDAAEYFDATDICDTRRAIEKVVYGVDVTKDLITKGRERVKKFTWARCAEETRAVYGQLS